MESSKGFFRGSCEFSGFLNVPHLKRSAQPWRLGPKFCLDPCWFLRSLICPQEGLELHGICHQKLASEVFDGKKHRFLN